MCCEPPCVSVAPVVGWASFPNSSRVRVPCVGGSGLPRPGARPWGNRGCWGSGWLRPVPRAVLPGRRAAANPAAAIASGCGQTRAAAGGGCAREARGQPAAASVRRQQRPRAVTSCFCGEAGKQDHGDEKARRREKG